MTLEQLPFRAIVAVDFEFEFGGHAGNRPNPVCMVAKELRTGQCWRVWRGEFGSTPPFPTGPDTLFVAFYASAELGCMRALGWRAPARILDLFIEFRAHTNGLGTPAGNGLVGALIYFGLDTIGAQTKDTMRDLVLRGGPWSETERADILQYCASDVDALERLLPAMLPHIDLPRALLRGRYMAAAAAIEHNGIPIDVSTLTVLRAHWTDIQDALISDIDADYGVFDGRTFKTNRFEAFLARHDIPWPRLESGSLDLDRDTFRQMAKSYPIISPLRELRHALSEMRLNDLAVGHDGRNRALLSVFSSKTGRNQPSNSKYIFGPSAWLRGLIKPSPGHAVAYVDWSNQEFGIAAKLSGDNKMLEAYQSGDPYLAFGKQCGKLPGMRPSHRTPMRDNYSNSACSAFSTAWKRRHWHSGSDSRRSSRASCCARIAKPTKCFGTGPTRQSITPCWGEHCIRCLAGAFASAKNPIHARCGIFRCRPTPPKCCGWRVAWRPNAASKYARRYMTPF